MSRKDGRDVRITEKSEKARREFFQKCEKIKTQAGHSEKLIQDIANRAANEYTKVFGRLGMHPLLHLKGGKKRPRYLVDRDETWVIYKPPLWQMGGSHEAWRRNVQSKAGQCKNLGEAEEAYLSSDKAETLQEWHGLLSGLLWIPPEYVETDMKGWGFIQRLDLETDGPVIIAKTWRAQRALQIQMKEHVNTKAYMCLVHGRLENSTQHIKRKFAELGSEQTTQVMLQHDQVNDPFFDWSMHGKWGSRSVRMAETFFKPLAYFHREEDNSDYTLVYVNILTGITHQIRITMQSVGHPLVSDDRYLPREQALSDLKWCPRNFLVEVRSDFFDVTGPFEDEARRRYTRVSIENPLPKVFQNVLTQKLTLTEKLDEGADLFVGPQHWAIGDQELMNAHVKDNDFRSKVMRWGQRRGIHLDALDRLLLLPMEEIDEVLNTYKSPEELGCEKYSTWVCPKCMHWNTGEASARFDKDPDTCAGGSVIGALGRVCDGTRLSKPDAKLPNGWLNYAKDPTIHFLFTVNHRWLDARRSILKNSRPSWEKAPAEAQGTVASEAVLAILAAALEQKIKQGEVGINDVDLKKFPGLEDIETPLVLPPDHLVTRMRLPGRGTGSQWTYTLRADTRVKWTSEVDKRPKRLLGPLFVKTDPLPPRQIAEDDDEDDEEVKGDEGLSALKLSMGIKEAPPEKKARRPRQWEKRESKSNPGAFYYIDVATGETTVDKPPDYEPKGKKPATAKPADKFDSSWERQVSKSSGKAYYYNSVTGESRVDPPSGPGVQIKGMPAKDEEEEAKWERKESSSKPGSFYYFNNKTGENEVTPPVPDYPWKVCESKTKKGQYFYFNEATGTTVVDPPLGARKASSNGSRTPPRAKPAASGGKDRLPSGWVRQESEKYKGKFYYTNQKTGETSWTKPSPWERVEAKSSPGLFYYKNVETGETSWDRQIVGVMPEKSKA